MKNSYLRGVLVLMMLFSGFASNGQDCITIYDDYESNRLFSSYDEVGGTIDSAHANPSPNAINNSATCLKYTRGAGNPFDAFVISTDQVKNGDFFKGNLVTFEIDVLSPVTGSLDLMLRSSGSGPFPAGRFNKLEGQIDVANEWTTVTFEGDIFYQPDETVHADSIKEIEVQPLTGQTLAHEIYFDNIRIINIQTIDNFDSDRSNPVDSHDGTFVEDVANTVYNQLNFSSRYGTFKKGLFEANSGIVYDLGAISLNDAVTGKSNFMVSVIAHSWGMDVSVSLINKAAYALDGGGIHSEYHGLAPTLSKWNNVTFDLEEIINENVDVDGVLLQFEPGVVSSNTYEFDNFVVFYPSPDAPVILGASGPCIGDNPYTYSIDGFENAVYNWSVTSEGEIIGDATGGAVDIKFLDLENNGFVNVQASVQESGKCPSGMTSRKINFSTALTTVDAGNDITICEDELIILDGSFSGANSVVWSTQVGNGSFTKGPDAATSIFKMNEEDVAFGFIDFTIISVGGNCGNETDDLVVTINELAKVYLEEEYSLCPNVDSVILTPTTNVAGGIQYWGDTGEEFSLPSPLTSGEEVVYTLPSWIDEPGESTSITFHVGDGYICGSENHLVKFIRVAETDETCIITSSKEAELNELTVVPTFSENGTYSVVGFNPGDIIQVVDAVGNTEVYHAAKFSTRLKGQLIVKHVSGDEVSVSKVIH